MHRSSILRMAWFRDTFLKTGSVLDVGSMDINGSYRELFTNFDYTGLDIAPGKNVDIVVKDHYYWREINSNSYDVVISGQAFEHIEYFWLTMVEMVRVLKPEGLLCIIAPRGFKEHRHPVDCWRFLSDGMRALAKHNGLQVLQCSTNQAPSVKDYDWFSDTSGDTMLVAKKSSKQTYEITMVNDRRSRLRKWINKILK